jgi:hypothetical protein
MGAIALVALIFGAWTGLLSLRRRAELYRERARYHSEMEGTLRSIVASGGDNAPVDYSPGPGLPSVRFTARAMTDYHVALRRKYELAAASPWLLVQPDPLPSQDGLESAKPVLQSMFKKPGAELADRRPRVAVRDERAE